MPVYNAERFIDPAIRSVLAQTWEHWELIVVDDGSTDGTNNILARCADPRIRSFRIPHGGVSRARNHGLDRAAGSLVVFFDADDILPETSIQCRVEALMAHPEADFADGAVLAMDSRTGALSPRHAPVHQGEVFDRLMRMDPSIFFGPTWMIRRSVIGTHRLPEHMTHAEDLAFYLAIARNRRYISVSQVVLHYRTGHRSAMSNIDGLHQGYRALYRFATQLDPAPDTEQLRALWSRIERIMVRTYIKAGRPISALRAWMERPAIDQAYSHGTR